MFHTVTTHPTYTDNVNITDLFNGTNRFVLLAPKVEQLVSDISADGFAPEVCASVLQQVVSEWATYIQKNYDGSTEAFFAEEHDSHSEPDYLIGTLQGFIGDDNLYLYLGC